MIRGPPCTMQNQVQGFSLTWALFTADFEEFFQCYVLISKAFSVIGLITDSESLRGCWKTSDSSTPAERHSLVVQWGAFRIMAAVTAVLKAVSLFVADLISSFTDWFQTKPAWANPEVLGETELKTTGGVHERHKAKTLWEKTGAVVMVVRRPGWLLCREEAAELSSLKSQLLDLEVPLFAVVKENIGKELECFKKFFSGKVYVDQKRNFYGPRMRWMCFSMFLRIGVWRNIWRAFRRGFRGNIKGEGLILGGVFVIGPGDQGILLEHREKEFGDKVNMLAVLRTARKMKENLPR